MNIQHIFALECVFGHLSTQTDLNKDGFQEEGNKFEAHASTWSGFAVLEPSQLVQTEASLVGGDVFFVSQK